MKTTVVNIKQAPEGWRSNPQYVYIGRANSRLGLSASVWANPYRIGADGTREEVIERYRIYLLNRLIKEPELGAHLDALSGKTLICWCKQAGKDVPCHGDILAQLIDGKESQCMVQLELFK